MKRLELIQLLADPDELDRDAGHFFYADRGTTASITVKLCQDHAVQFQRFVKRFSTVDCVLAGHRIADEQNLIGLYLSINLFELFHQILVDVQTTGSIEDDDVDARLLSGNQTVGTNLERRRSRRSLTVDGHTQLLADNLQLLNSGRALQVGGDEHRLFALLFEHLRQLAAGCGFTTSLKPAHHDLAERIFTQVQGMVRRTH